MAESLVLSAEASALPDDCLNPPAPSSNGSSSPTQRRIEFHPARKPFNGFSNGGGDFRLETLNPSSDSRRPPQNPGQSAMGGRKTDGFEFLENGLDPELTLGITFRRIGAGLENLGNTCFLNSVLQCLTYTEPLAAYLQSGKHQNSCKIAGFCALCAIQKHVSRALQSSGRILAPKDLVSNLRCISRNFRNARQEDAHEYMVNLLESMHKCCLPSGVPSESPSAYDKSLVHKIFGGRLRSQVKCMQCSYCSNTFDPFLDLSLEIVKADSLQKALTNFTAPEQLDGGERQYQCQRCKQKVRALKQLSVHKAPYVLTIHLKRFRAYNPGQKIDKKVQFGPSLDLKPFVSGSYEGDLKYTLYGVLVHCGFSTHSGHYYCYVRTSSGTWYSLDDNQVVPVGERTVLEQKAYMLFYVRDRRNNAARKPIDVVQKENLKANNGGNSSLLLSKKGCNGAVQNGTVENKSNGVACSAAVTQKNTLDIGSTKQGCKGSVQSGTIENRSNGAADSVALTQKDALTVGSTKRGYNGPVQNGTVENRSDGAARSVALTQKDVLDVGSTKPGHSGSFQNVTVVNRSNGTGCSGTPKDALIVGSPKELPKQSNGFIPVEYPVLEKDAVSKSPLEPPPEPSSDAASSKDKLKGLSLSNSDVLKQLQPVENGRVLNPEDSTKTTAGTSKKGLIDSVDALPSSNNPPNSDIYKLPSGETSQKNNVVSKVVVSSLVPSVVPSDKTLEKIDPVRSLDQPSRDNSQVGNLNKRAANDLMNDKVGYGSQRLAADESKDLSGSSIVTNRFMSEETRSCMPKRKLRKKLRKCQIASMRLGTKVLFGALSLRKKKFKKSKRRHGLDSKNVREEHLLASNYISSDFGPSTSEKTHRISLHAAHVERRKVKSCSKRVNIAASAAAREAINSLGGDSLINDLNFKERIGQSGAVLAADAREPDRLKGSEGEEGQTDMMMSMLTRGIEETHVARWDGAPSQIVQSKSSQSISIGHVLDEWDEEYDRGKRKKVRTYKHTFGGPNPFQEVATKKMHLKKPRTDQSSSGNRPFRI